jgi:ribose-phosphate pyrophosphokinase
MYTTINFPEGKATGEFEMFRYPGGEVQVRLDEHMVNVLYAPGITGVRVVARIYDGEITALAQLIDAIKSVTTAPITLVLPYLPYSRADRRFTEGDCDGLAVFGRMLGMMVTDVVTLDAHSEKAERNIRHLTNVSAKPIIGSVIDRMDGTYVYGTPVLNTAVLLPDKGASRYGDYPSCEKVRDPRTGKLTGFKVPDYSKFDGADNILIIDDICDGGGTFIGIAEQMKSCGLPISLYVTHGIFSKGFIDLFKNFKDIYTTDSYSTRFCVPEEFADRFHVIKAMPIISDTLDKRGKIQ